MVEYLQIKKAIKKTKAEIEKLKKKLKEEEKILENLIKRQEKIKGEFPYPAHFSFLEYEYNELKKKGGTEEDLEDLIEEYLNQDIIKHFNKYAMYEMQEFIKKLKNEI